LIKNEGSCKHWSEMQQTARKSQQVDSCDKKKTCVGEYTQQRSIPSATTIINLVLSIAHLYTW
jgi:hypothetical protein